MDSQLQQAIRAVKNGDTEDGRRLLIEVLRVDPENEVAWLWLASAVKGERRRQALEKVLEINPDNTLASQELSEFQSEKGVSIVIEKTEDKNSKLPILIGALALGIVLVCATGLLMLNLVRDTLVTARSSDETNIAVATNGEATVQPTPRPRVSCPGDEVQAYINELDFLIEEWDDVVILAGSTSRMALSPVIKEMQDIRRNARRIERPECADYLHDMVMVAMDARIDTFISFLSQESDSVVSRKMQGADSVRETVDDEILAFRQDPMAAYLASETSASQLQEQTEEAQPFERPGTWADVTLSPASGLLISYPSDWLQRTSGDQGQFVILESADGNMTLSLGVYPETFITDLDSDAARLFALQTSLETSEYDYYLERNAETGVYAENKAYVVEFSRRETEGDDVEDSIWAVVVTPQGDEVLLIANTERDEFAQIEMLTLQEIYASIRRGG